MALSIWTIDIPQSQKEKHCGVSKEYSHEEWSVTTTWLAGSLLCLLVRDPKERHWSSRVSVTHHSGDSLHPPSLSRNLFNKCAGSSVFISVCIAYGQ